MRRKCLKKREELRKFYPEWDMVRCTYLDWNKNGCGDTIFMELFDAELNFPYIDDLGSFTIHWPADENWDIIVTNGYETFTALCRAFTELRKIAVRKKMVDIEPY